MYVMYKSLGRMFSKDSIKIKVKRSDTFCSLKKVAFQMLIEKYAGACGKHTPHEFSVTF